MNQVITINLNGRAFQLEEDGHDALRDYLDDSARALTANPDRDEIIADIERAIADKFRLLIGANKDVVLTTEVAAVLAEMGPVDDGSGTAGADRPRAASGLGDPPPGGASAPPGGTRPPARNLFKIREGAMIGGVCNGLGAFFNVDPSLIRLACVLLLFMSHGVVILAYLILMFVLPVPLAADIPLASGGRSPARRVYKIREGEMIGGVCNGLGAYFNFDTTLVRLACLLLLFLSHGTVILAYLVLLWVVPYAETDADKSAAYGAPYTAREFVRRARAGYYEGLKGFPDRAAWRAWSRRFSREMRAWGRSVRWEIRAGACNWQGRWAQPPVAQAPWCGVVRPCLSLLIALLALVALAVLISLLGTASLFGHPLPESMPVWEAVFLLGIGYLLVLLPLKTARHFIPLPVHPATVRPMTYLWDALIWFGFIAVLLWLASHHGPEVRAAIRSIPTTIKEAVDAIWQWWHQVPPEAKPER